MAANMMIKAVALRRSLLRPHLLRHAASAASSSSSSCSSWRSDAPRWAPLSCSKVREFSAGSSSQKEEPVKVPITVHGVAGKYAAAFYVIAVRAKALEPIYEEMQQIVQAAEKSSTFADFLKDMSVSNKDKVKAVQGLFEELGFSEITVNFLALLAENGRLHGLKEIVNCLTELVLAYRKQVKAMVTTVVELKPKEMEDLKKSLKRFVKPDETILLEQKIDKRILGGLVVDIGEKHIDLSIATKLKNMERVLLEPLP